MAVAAMLLAGSNPRDKIAIFIQTQRITATIYNKTKPYTISN